MIEWIISSSVLILAVILLRFALRGRISLRLQYGLWALVLLRLLLPVSLFEADFSVMTAVEQSSAFEAVSDTMNRTQVFSGTMQNTELTQNEAEAVRGGTIYKTHGYSVQSGNSHLHTYFFRDSLSVVLGRVLKAVWLLGAAAMGIYLLSVNFLFHLRLRKTRVRIECAGTSLPVCISPEVKTPCLYGLFRPYIYFTEETAADHIAQGHVLAHELTHYRHWDHVWSFLRCACLALHWYNPLVWWAAFLSRRDAELACDEGAIRRLGEDERLSYGSTLIGLSCTTKKAEGVLLTATTMTGSKASLKERIRLIAEKPKTALITLLLVFAICLVAVGCTFTGAEGSDGLFRRYPSFTEWTESLTAEEIQWVEASKDYGVEKTSYTVPEAEYEELVQIFKTIQKDDCSRKGPEGSSLDGCHLALNRRDKLWLFKCLNDGTVGLMFNDPETGAYFGCEGKYLIIKNENLWNYIANTVDTKGTKREDIEVTPADQLAFTFSAKEIERLYNAGDGFEVWMQYELGFVPQLCITDPSVLERFETVFEHYSFEPLRDFQKHECNVIWLHSLDRMNGVDVCQHDYLRYLHDNGGTLDYWKATKNTSDAPSSLFLALVAEHDRIVAGTDGILFYSDMDMQKAFETFVKEEYANRLHYLAGGLTFADRTIYTVLDYELLEVSEDGTAGRGSFSFAIDPKDFETVADWGDAREGDGKLIVERQVLLERQEDGDWLVTVLPESGA